MGLDYHLWTTQTNVFLRYKYASTTQDKLENLFAMLGKIDFPDNVKFGRGDFDLTTPLTDLIEKNRTHEALQMAQEMNHRHPKEAMWFIQSGLVAAIRGNHTELVKSLSEIACCCKFNVHEIRVGTRWCSDLKEYLMEIGYC